MKKKCCVVLSILMVVNVLICSCAKQGQLDTNDFSSIEDYAGVPFEEYWFLMKKQLKQSYEAGLEMKESGEVDVYTQYIIDTDEMYLNYSEEEAEVEYVQSVTALKNAVDKGYRKEDYIKDGAAEGYANQIREAIESGDLSEGDFELISRLESKRVSFDEYGVMVENYNNIKWANLFLRDWYADNIYNGDYVRTGYNEPEVLLEFERSYNKYKEELKL